MSVEILIVKVVATIIIFALIAQGVRGLWEYYKDIKDTKSGDFLFRED